VCPLPKILGSDVAKLPFLQVATIAEKSSAINRRHGCKRRLTVFDGKLIYANVQPGLTALW